MQFQIREANRNDINTIYDFIKGLAIYEKLENEFIATHSDLETTIFDQKYANVLIGNEIDEVGNETPVCFAL